MHLLSLTLPSLTLITCLVLKSISTLFSGVAFGWAEEGMALLLCSGNHLRLLGFSQLVALRIILGDPLKVLSPWHLFKQSSCHQRWTSAPAMEFVFQSCNVQSVQMLWVSLMNRWTPKLAHRVRALSVFRVCVTEQGSKRMQSWADDPLRLGTADAQSLSTSWIRASSPGRVPLQGHPSLGHPCQVTTDKRGDNPATYTFPLRDGLSSPFQTQNMAQPHAAHQQHVPERDPVLGMLLKLLVSVYRTEFVFPQVVCHFPGCRFLPVVCDVLAGGSCLGLFFTMLWCGPPPAPLPAHWAATGNWDCSIIF